MFLHKITLSWNVISYFSEKSENTNEKAVPNQVSEVESAENSHDISKTERQCTCGEAIGTSQRGNRCIFKGNVQKSLLFLWKVHRQCYLIMFTYFFLTEEEYIERIADLNQKIIDLV